LPPRYVVRAKAGQRKSSEVAGGKIAHFVGASIHRHNELASKKVCRLLAIEEEGLFFCIGRDVFSKE
nr:ankyrin repeat and zinc finger domain-containing protein 1 [Tanacetum cinerariifolium]